MKMMYRLAAGAILTVALQSNAAAQTQFYNGDFDGDDALFSGTTPDGGRALVYENFTVGGSGLFVTGLFGSFLSNGAWTSVYWEVRSGITPGNGGSLLWSDTDAATRVFTGTGFGFNLYESAVSGLNFFLTPGEYWFGLAPLVTPGQVSYLATASGANGVNANLDGQAYFQGGTYFSGNNYVLNYSEALDYSLGVEGRLGESTVPEPATMTLLATGLAGLAGARRRKRTNA